MRSGIFACISSNLNFLFKNLKRPKVLIVKPVHTSSFNVFFNGVLSSSAWSNLAESRNDSDVAYVHGTGCTGTQAGQGCMAWQACMAASSSLTRTWSASPCDSVLTALRLTGL
jgi:hypothetical protein